jgi:hippurate hydrolase
MSNGARNIVCDKVILECSLRSFYKIRRKRFLEKLTEISKTITKTNNCEIHIDFSRYLPELKNDLCLFEKYRHLIDEVIAPVYQSEDFSLYGLESKTLFFFLGIGDVPGLHTNKFHFDVNILEKGLDTFIKIATTR